MGASRIYVTTCVLGRVIKRYTKSKSGAVLWSGLQIQMKNRSLCCPTMAVFDFGMVIRELGNKSTTEYRLIDGQAVRGGDVSVQWAMNFARTNLDLRHVLCPNSRATVPMAKVHFAITYEPESLPSPKHSTCGSSYSVRLEVQTILRRTAYQIKLLRAQQVVCLSATPMINKPNDLSDVLYLL